MKKRKVSGWSLLVLLVIFISLITAVLKHSAPLPYYQTTVSDVPKSEIQPTLSTVETVQYINENPSFTVNIPTKWTKVTKNGYTTWIDKATATSFQIQIAESTSEILKVTEESVAAELNNVGADLVRFYWVDEWNYACMYHTFQETGTTINIEITAFNRRHIIRFAFVINAIHYENLESTVSTIIDSFAWDRFSS